LFGIPSATIASKKASSHCGGWMVGLNLALGAILVMIGIAISAD